MSYHPSIAKAHSVPQCLNLSEALDALKPPVQQPPRKPVPSYFTPYVEELYKNPSTIPIRVETVPTSPPHIYHPAWNGWEGIWGAPQLQLDPNRILPPLPELDFHNVLFRLQVTAQDLRGVDGPHFILQGTMLAFKGFDASRVRYIIEWCYRVEGQKTYLKVVGISKNQIPYPYNDPHFPSFILVVPTHLACVAPLPSLGKAPRRSTVLQILNKLQSSCHFMGRRLCPTRFRNRFPFTSPFSSTYLLIPDPVVYSERTTFAALSLKTSQLGLRPQVPVIRKVGWLEANGLILASHPSPSRFADFGTDSEISTIPLTISAASMLLATAEHGESPQYSMPIHSTLEKPSSSVHLAA